MTKSRVSWIEYKGKKILFTDYSYATPDEVIATVNESCSVSATQEKKSILQIVDTSEVEVDRNSWQEYKIKSKEMAPYFKATAVIGLDATKKFLATAIKILTKRNIKTFDSVELAKEWLVNQE